MPDEKDADEVVSESLEVELPPLTLEQDARQRAFENTMAYMGIGRDDPVSIHEVFEWLHYMSHWLTTGEVPPKEETPKNKFKVV